MTVGSLAISATVRPPIVPMPVTTPSAPSPSASQLASSASSVNEPGSSSRATRSRTGSLPCSAALRDGAPARPRRRARTPPRASLMAANLAGRRIVVAHPHHDLVVGARGQRPLDRVAVGLGRERRRGRSPAASTPPPSASSSSGHHSSVSSAPALAATRNASRCATPSQAAPGHAVDGAVGDQAAARAEHDELPERRAGSLAGRRRRTARTRRTAPTEATSAIASVARPAVMTISSAWRGLPPRSTSEASTNASGEREQQPAVDAPGTPRRRSSSPPRAPRRRARSPAIIARSPSCAARAGYSAAAHSSSEVHTSAPAGRSPSKSAPSRSASSSSAPSSSSRPQTSSTDWKAAGRAALEPRLQRRARGSARRRRPRSARAAPSRQRVVEPLLLERDARP